MPSIPNLIWTSLKPVLKLFGSIAIGFVLGRAGIIDPMSSKVLAKLSIKVFGVCLTLTSAMNAFNLSNLPKLGPIMTFSMVFLVMASALGVIFERFVRPSKNFKWGMVAAIAFGNGGDLPMSMIQGIADKAPFKSGDVDLGIAYASSFVSLQQVIMYTLGYMLISIDFQQDAEDALMGAAESGTISSAIAEKSATSLVHLKGDSSPTDGEKCKEINEETLSAEAVSALVVPPMKRVGLPPEIIVQDRDRDDDLDSEPDETPDLDMDLHLADDAPPPIWSQLSRNRRPSAWSTRASARRRSIASKRAGSNRTLGSVSVQMVGKDGSVVEQQKPAGPKTLREKWAALRESKSFQVFCDGLFSVRNASLIVGIAIGLVPVIKNLLITPDSTVNNAPLSFIYEFLKFMGGAFLPVNQINLGAALGRFKTTELSFGPGGLGRVTIAVCIARLLIMPVMGISMVEAATFWGSGFVGPEDMILRLMLMLQACTPSGNLVVVLTQLLDPTGKASNIATVVLFEYIICIFTLTISLVVILTLLSG